MNRTFSSICHSFVRRSLCGNAREIYGPWFHNQNPPLRAHNKKIDKKMRFSYQFWPFFIEGGISYRVAESPASISHSWISKKFSLGFLLTCFWWEADWYSMFIQYNNIIVAVLHLPSENVQRLGYADWQTEENGKRKRCTVRPIKQTKDVRSPSSPVFHSKKSQIPQHVRSYETGNKLLG